jgi:hypothetical protein
MDILAVHEARMEAHRILVESHPGSACNLASLPGKDFREQWITKAGILDQTGRLENYSRRQHRSTVIRYHMIPPAINAPPAAAGVPYLAFDMPISPI